jgi:hypothetical protein
MSNTRNTPVINTDDNFISFLRYMESEEGFAAEELIDVVAKPWKWKKEYLKFLTKHYFDINKVCDLEFEYDDVFCESFLSAATYEYPDGTFRYLECDELEWIQDQNECWFHEELLKNIY